VELTAEQHDDFLAHYGILRKSGRYPWGSGDTQNQRNKTFLDVVKQHQREGMKETDIAKAYGMSINDLRALKSIARNEQKQSQIGMAQKLKDKGMSNVAIGERMGIGESQVRNLLAPGAKDKADALLATADMLRKEADTKKFVDVGSGVSNHLNVTETRLDTALAVLKEEGYSVHRFRDPQVASGHSTNKVVLVPPGVTQKEAWMNADKVQLPSAVSSDHGRTFETMQPPIQLNPNRIKVRYKEEGGDEADGVLYIRPGVKDVSLGGSNYAQVRVAVGKDHYIKGMAMYKDDLPDGVDIEFNTNKSNTGNKLDALKKNEQGENPFGTVVDQIFDRPGHPDAKVTSSMNIVNEEGDWAKWSRTLSSQFLSKQDHSLAKRQLDATYSNRKKELDEINALTNATVKKKLLEDFAESTDSAAVHLKAAKMPRQGVHVILPIQDMKPNEIYAPNFTPGETVVLVRHPHGGTFEIPELRVNNSHPTAKKLLGDTRDAVGIHADVAKRLSGADFDGDTVLVIPNNDRSVKVKPALHELKDFDPLYAYPGYPGMKVMRNTQAQMGEISNLITDMTLKGAPDHEIAKAVKHSMVVIDAEKKELDYKRSYEEQGIRDLKRKYQGSARGGASTLISLSRRPKTIDQQELRPMRRGGPIDRETGKLVYEPTGKKNYKTGKPIQEKRETLAVTDDAHVLSSGTPMEKLYAEHSNKMKSLANQARLSYVNTPNPRMSPSAKTVYAPQVKTLKAKLDIAERNRPLERQAQVIAKARVEQQKAANPNMDSKFEKKVKFQAQEAARIMVGAKKEPIDIGPDEWEAIQAGAISNHQLVQILKHAKMDKVREYATPKRTHVVSESMARRAQAMLDSGASRAQIARQLGVPLGTLDEALYGKED
jgi:hypothetical protein